MKRIVLTLLLLNIGVSLASASHNLRDGPDKNHWFKSLPETLTVEQAKKAITSKKIEDKDKITWNLIEDYKGKSLHPCSRYGERFALRLLQDSFVKIRQYKMEKRFNSECPLYEPDLASYQIWTRTDGECISEDHPERERTSCVVFFQKSK